jgi:RND family efflux transporter MFP subunit
MNINVVIYRRSFMVFAMFLAGCKPTDRSMEPVSLEKTSSSPLERVTAGSIPRKTLQLYSLQPARVEAYQQAPILSKISGYVESVAVDVGDSVRKGEPLIVLTAPEYKDSVVTKQGLIDQANAQVKQAQAALVATQAAVGSALAQVQQAIAGIDRAEAEMTRWKSESLRISELADKGTVTKKQADETFSQYQAAMASKKEMESIVVSEQAKLLEAESSVGKSQADLEASKAKLAVAVSEHAQAVTMAGYLVILAPFDGVVTLRNVDRGHYVQPAGSKEDQPLLIISDTSRVRIHVDVPEAEAGFVDFGGSGDPVELSIPSEPGRRILCKVTRISSSLDPQSRCLPIQVELDNSEHKLLPGAFVQAKVSLVEKKEVLALPVGAVCKNGDATYCCLVMDGKIVTRSIQLGIRVGDDVEVLSGLDASETVVLARAGGLKNGQGVEILTKK